MLMKKQFAVVLSGCGVYDGAEIHEATLTLLAIARQGASYQCFAPDIRQAHVVNHLTGEVMNQERSVLVESARIARGNIKPLRDFQASAFDAIVFPGGFGVAKNLCTYAFDGDRCTVDPDTEKAVRDMHGMGKPIGALCISPVLISRIIGDVQVTIGSDAATAADISRMGGKHVVGTHGEVVTDPENRVVTTPCYMLDATIDQIASGAENLVKTILEMV